MILWNQASISNSFRDIQCRMSRSGWHDLDTTSKRRSRSFILVPIDFSSTFYRLSLVTFALGRHDCLATIHFLPTDRQTDDGRNTIPIVRLLVRSAEKCLVFDKNETFMLSYGLLEIGVLFSTAYARSVHRLPARLHLSPFHCQWCSGRLYATFAANTVSVCQCCA